MPVMHNAIRVGARDRHTPRGEIRLPWDTWAHGPTITILHLMQRVAALQQDVTGELTPAQVPIEKQVQWRMCAAR